MYPPAFDYAAVTSVEEALSLLAEKGEEARILAGGQSLIPMMKLRLASPGFLVDINRIPGLDGIEESDGHLLLGALVRHRQVVDSPLVARLGPTLAAAAPWVADPLVRNRGTVCGSVAHCDPEGDWNSVMLAARAEVVARGPSGERTIPIDDFIVDYFTNALAPGEMVTAVRVPRPDGPTGGAYLKLERKVGDYATAAVAVQLELGADGTIAAAGIALTAVNPRNTRAVEAERLLAGNEPGDELFEEAAAEAAAAASPQSDVRGTADWKRQVVREYTRRGLTRALEQARAA